MIVSAYKAIADDVAKLKQHYGAERIGVILGTSTSGILASERAFKYQKRHGAFPQNYHYEQQEIGTCARFLADYAQLEGPAYVISTACSSSAKAFSAAERLLRNDVCDAVIVGGCDSLCEFTLNGFDCLELIDTNHCQPFSKNRNGINIGEGAALFILSKQPAPMRLLAVGESSDAYHMSAPDPQATGAINAMNQALTASRLSPQQIGYINLHGTATQHNDAMESLAIYSVFGDTATHCSSTKPLTGHTLGAAGAHDLALCWLLLSEYNPHQQLPAQLSDHVIDPQLKPINLLTESTRWKTPIFMSNSFGFGGSNVSVLIGKEV